jgi:surface antigen/LysM repeat protein
VLTAQRLGQPSDRWQDDEPQWPRRGQASNTQVIPFESVTPPTPAQSLAAVVAGLRARPAIDSRIMSHRGMVHGMMLTLAVGLVSASFYAGQQGGASGFNNSDAGTDPASRAAIVMPAIPSTQPSTVQREMEAAAMAAVPAPPVVQDASAPPPPVKPAPDLKTYTVEDGDNPFDLALNFGITEETLLGANGLDADSLLQIGQPLLVPPVNGVVVSTQPGESAKAIADQWKLDLTNLLSINKLSSDNQPLLPGEALMLPGAMPAVQIYPIDTTPISAPTAVDKPLSRLVATARPKAAAPAPVVNRNVAVRASGPNYFPYGQCTWWAAQERPDIGGRVVGNASAWLYSARAAGLATGSRPQVGAIVVYQPGAQGAGWTGHVAYVSSVASNGTSFTISEMNFPYWGRVTTRASWTGGGVSFIY